MNEQKKRLRLTGFFCFLLLSRCFFVFLVCKCLKMFLWRANVVEQKKNGKVIQGVLHTIACLFVMYVSRFSFRSMIESMVTYVWIAVIYICFDWKCCVRDHSPLFTCSTLMKFVIFFVSVLICFFLCCHYTVQHFILENTFFIAFYDFTLFGKYHFILLFSPSGISNVYSTRLIDVFNHLLPMTGYAIFSLRNRIREQCDFD